MQRLTRLQVVLLSGDTFLPQVFFPLVGAACQFQTALARSQFTALFGNLRTGDHRQQITGLDLLPEHHSDRLDHPGCPGHHVRGAVFIETDLPRQRQGTLQLPWTNGGQLDTGQVDLLLAERDRALLLVTGLGRVGMAALTFLFMLTFIVFMS
ncbi:hypothetical protein D3C79_675430 [compost metagenome]